MDVQRVIGTGSSDGNTDSTLDAPHSDRSPSQEAVRTAGILLMIACGLDLATWAIQTRWGWEPTALGIAETALQAVLGVGLIWSGRTWVVPTMVFVTAAALIPCIRTALSDVPDHFIWMVLAVPFVIGLLRIAPFILLLTSQETRLRHAAAIGSFALSQLIELAGAGMNIYAIEWIKRR